MLLSAPPINPPVLKHGNISLRLIKVSDAKRLQQLLGENRAWLERWEAGTPGMQRAEPGSYSLKPAIKNMRQGLREGYGVPFVMLYKGEVVGQLSISDIAWGAVRSGQLGYWIAEEYAGLNITPTCVALAIDYVLKHGGLHRMEICLRPENKASRRVVQKLGLRYEGMREDYIYIDGGWRDHECYAITTPELGEGLIKRL